MLVYFHSPERKCNEAQRRFVLRRLTFALGRFAGRVRQVNVTFRDENGARGGFDTVCKIEARLQPRGEVRVQSTSYSMESSADLSIDRLTRIVRRLTERRNDRRHRVPMGGHLYEAS